MASQHQSSKNGKSSLKYWWIPLEVQSLEPDLIVLNKNLCTPSTSSQKGGLPSNRRPNKGLTISHFRSAAAGLWDYVGQPAICLSEDNFKYDNLYEKVNLFQLDSERDVPAVFVDNKIFQKNAELRTRYKATAKSNFEDLRRIKKMLLFASCNRNINSFYFQSTAISTGETNKAAEVASNGMAGTAGNLTTKPYFGLKDFAKFTKDGCQEMDESYTVGKVSSDLPDIQITNNFYKAEDTDLVIKTTHLSKNEQKPPSSLSSERTLQASTCAEKAETILRKPISGLQTSCNMEILSSSLESDECQKLINSTSVISEALEEASATNYQNTCENDNFFGSLSLIGNFSPKPWLTIQNKLQLAFSNNRHAIAGALAGTLVTLCLHPVDTVKTIIQANEMGQKSFYRVLRRIISQHGIVGLYRGIGSNITSSAPISAIYTFTYESVKCSLLPLLPNEYHSFAHCIAGGCSSIATSFVFTPSERIKQQMQVSSQYQNCWKALIGCLQKGGIPSLYAGWGAVLCRNIPHSIIKFYTYESLKQIFSSVYPDSNLQTFHTLVCGGLAGSTAALFTTPFDVVKTRLQIQPPGSIGKYHGVFHALQEIAKQEGLQGLYRGLTPRLVMYVSQGAIFFASYEFLKAVFLLETPENSTKLKEDEICLDDPAAAGLEKLPA
ncbi:hypothetical protein KFK09_009813 [Dendrobium nobile]|uniref:Mitochondrial substrate carrier family protein n=1 Tax=Dendrobium nobile TaxID=94219 RepID=A0A8T3BMI2_DENNO|nr:hypothetical protein KFK09_009813 [Dendrobium nobile]